MYVLNCIKLVESVQHDYDFKTSSSFIIRK